MFVCYQFKKFELIPPTPPPTDAAWDDDRNHLYAVVLPGASRQPGQRLGAVVLSENRESSEHLQVMVLGTSVRPTEHVELMVIDPNRRRGSHLLEVDLPVRPALEAQPDVEDPAVVSPPPISQFSIEDPSYTTARRRVSSTSSGPAEVRLPLTGQRTREGSTSGVSGLSSDSGKPASDAEPPARPPKMCRYDGKTDRCSRCSKLQVSLSSSGEFNLQ